MEIKTYKYIKENGPVKVSDVGEALHIKDVDALSIIEQLQKKGLVQLCPPRKLDIGVNSSCSYVVTEKKEM